MNQNLPSESKQQVIADTSDQRLQRFRRTLKHTPVKIKSEKKLTTPVPIPISSFRKDGYWENRKKVREQRERVRKEREE